MIDITITEHFRDTYISRVFVGIIKQNIYYVITLPFLFLSCMSPYDAGIKRASQYTYNPTDLWLDNAQKEFFSSTGFRPSRDLKEVVDIFFYSNLDDLKKECRSETNVYGCLPSYLAIAVYDTEDEITRCQTVLHEALHILFGLKSYEEKSEYDFDALHNSELFNTVVFRVENCY